MKTLKLIFTLLFAVSINAQNFQGKAIYKTSRKSTFKFNKENKGVDDKMQEEIRKRMQKMNQKTFILNFDKNTSTYKQEEKLNAPKKPNANGVMMVSFGGASANSIYYKNLKEKRYAHKKDIQGKTFLIKDDLKTFDWKLSSETKSIGNYTCYKATFSKEVENKKMSFINGESKEETVKETIVTTAWYTPQVPVSNGPDNFFGLPGLILEINDGKRMMVCTELILNSKNEINISEPKKGKVVNQKKFNEIQKKKSEELMEKFKSRNGMDLGNGLNIKFGN